MSGIYRINSLLAILKKINGLPVSTRQLNQKDRLPNVITKGRLDVQRQEDDDDFKSN